MRKRKAQSALEYIFATIAFTVVGVGLFGVISNAAWRKTGSLEAYDLVSGSVNADTVAGKVLQDGVTQNKVWPGVDASYDGSWRRTRDRDSSAMEAA